MPARGIVDKHVCNRSISSFITGRSAAMIWRIFEPQGIACIQSISKAELYTCSALLTATLSLHSVSLCDGGFGADCVGVNHSSRYFVVFLQEVHTRHEAHDTAVELAINELSKRITSMEQKAEEERLRHRWRRKVTLQSSDGGSTNGTCGSPWRGDAGSPAFRTYKKGCGDAIRPRPRRHCHSLSWPDPR